MSRATELIAECKAALADVDKAIIDFEHDAESDIGHWTDLAQLDIAKNRLVILRDTLRSRQANAAIAKTQDRDETAPAKTRRPKATVSNQAGEEV